MMLDPITALKDREKNRRFFWALLAAALAVFAASYAMFAYEYSFPFMDLYIHANLASEFDFADLHSITCRLSYPMWHVFVSALYQLGVPLSIAAAGMCALCKTLVFVLTCLLVHAMGGKRRTALIVSLLLMVVTGILIPSVNPRVYRTIGSPNVWHNPTQQIVTAAMLMVMPWLAHCWYEFERRLTAGEKKITLPWGKVLVLAILGAGSVACKPTFMQALLPAAFVMFLVELIRHKTEWRYFGQIVLAFLPTVGYFLLSYLYYTGVVVEFTSGVDIGVTAETARAAVRSALVMSACPLFAVIACYRKGLFKDRMLVLALLMVAFSALEAMAFRETGMRENHGNFTWAANSSAFFLWVVMAGVFVRSFCADVKAGALTLWRKLGYAVTVGLFGWHVVSGVYYLVFLLTTGNAF